ncbi:MAG TPA: TonB-dependent receptor [Chryseolinea sp.]|nr:TonB-dependent receptor [Chryseolinea sp.]HPH45372.1 TonB-dependent receptor [Chryseolinea sp.]HPM28725.1 TonB-dependent receptor [Chryseolinea sp.]
MKYVYTTLFVLLCFSVQAQFPESEFNSNDSLKTSYLDELVISANKIPEQRRTVAQQIKVVSSTTIRNFNAQNSADLISNSGVVAMQKSQQGGGSAMMRGFEASRVLMMIDGVRMNNLIYRAGHLQNIITMDNNVLDRVEILFGPSSTVYGSDALGGVIHFYTRNPELAQSGQKKGFTGNAFYRYGSVNNESTGHVDFNIGGSKFASLTSFTFSDFGDLRMGEKTNPALDEQFGVRTQYAVHAEDNASDMLVQNSDPFVQKFSGYRQWDVMQKFLYQSSDRVSHVLNLQYSNSTNIPRYDRLTDPDGSGLRFGEWYYGPQTRLLGSYQLKIKEFGSFADGMTTTASYQHVEESRYDRRFNNNNRNERVENVDVMALTIDFQKKKGKNSFRYGFDSQFNTLKSTAHRYNVLTGDITPQSTRYPDGDNTMNMLSLYGTHTLQFNDQWTLNDGVRIGGSFLHSTFIDKSFYPFPFDEVKQNYLVSSANLGIIYTPSSWKFSFLVSTGYRAPNIDDVAKVFDSSPGNVVVPNPDLKSEKTINGEIGITKFFGSIARLEGTFYATQFFDAIVVLPTTFNGEDSIDYDGTLSRVLSAQNKGKAYIYGSSISLRVDFTKNLALTASHNYTYGRVLNEEGSDTPLDHIAPAFGRVGFQYNNSKFKSELFTNFSTWKHLDDYSGSGEDNLQYATDEGMPSWYTINIRASYELNKMFTLHAGIDNIMDLQYRVFASGINAPGRNIFGTLRIKF